MVSIRPTGVYGDSWASINQIIVQNGATDNRPGMGIPDASTRFLFGLVDGVSYFGTKVVVGQQVMFDANQAILVTQGGVTNFIANESAVLAQEIIPS